MSTGLGQGTDDRFYGGHGEAAQPHALPGLPLRFRDRVLLPSEQVLRPGDWQVYQCGRFPYFAACKRPVRRHEPVCLLFQ